MKRHLFALALTAGIGFTASAQTAPLTLEDCIRLGTSRNVDIETKRLQQMRAELQVEASRHAFLPTVSAGLSQSFDFGRSADKTGVMQDRSSSSSSLSLSGSIPLFTGLSRLHDMRAAKLSYESTSADIEQAHWDLRQQITSLYFSLLHAQRVAETAEREVATYDSIVSHANAMVQAGRWSADRLADAEAQRATSRLRRVEAQNAISTAHLELMQAIESTDMLPVETLDITDEVATASTHLAELRGNATAGALALPAFRANDLMTAAAREQVSSARAGYLPSLSLSAGYGNSYYYLLGSEYNGMNLSFADQWRQNGRTYLGLNLNIPIFDAFRTKRSIRSAKLELHSLALQRMALSKSVSKAVQQAELSASLALRRIDASRETLTSSTAAARLVRDRWEVGRATATELAEAHQRTYTAELDYINAQYEFVLRSRLLALYNGQ